MSEVRRLYTGTAGLKENQKAVMEEWRIVRPQELVHTRVGLTFLAPVGPGL